MNSINGICGGIIMLRVIVQYLLSPIVFPLTFILPVVFFFVSRKYAWFSILLTVLVEIIINWGNFCYYESRGLMVFVTLIQVAVMVIIILILRAGDLKRKS